jgi:hypothetical protein
MIQLFARVLLCATALALLPVSGTAEPLLSGTVDPTAQCNANFTSCLIIEDVLLQFPSPFLAISGDVILLDPQTNAVSDVFRIFNNVFNTGGGTGLGNMAFLYSSDDSTPLPNPATYSANAVTIMENPSGITHYVANGTDYSLNSVPEPGTFGLLVLGIGMMAVLSLKRRVL